MKVLETILGQRRTIFATVTLLALIGILAWNTMNRQEDPFFPYRGGMISVPFPGADPEQVERLIAKPLEEELYQVDSVDELRTTVRSGVAMVAVFLKDQVYDTDASWDEVRLAMDRAQREFPQEAGKARLNDKLMDSSGVVLAVSGSDDPITLLNAARKLRTRLNQIDNVARIELVGDPGEQVSILYDDIEASRLALSPMSFGSQLSSRSQVNPGGSLYIAGKTTSLKPNTEFRSLDEMRETPIHLPNGTSIPLGSFAEVNYGPSDPANEELWIGGERAVGLALFTPPNSVNVVEYGRRVRALIDDVRSEFLPLDIKEVFFQPDRVSQRLNGLNQSLLTGILIVAAVLFIFMGLRLGLVVALIVPVVTFSAVALYAMSGGVLHQIVVIGLVVALGMLVDNGIVMAENIQWHLDRGSPPSQAVAESVRKLALPLGTATATTVAAFIPMLLAEGNTPDFTRGISIMVILVLIISYVYAVFVTPQLSCAILRPRNVQARDMNHPEKSPLLSRLGHGFGQTAIKHTGLVILGAIVLVVGAGYMSQFVKKEFFPGTDRNQMLVDIELPEGTHINLTRDKLLTLQDMLGQKSVVTNVYSILGTSGPRFYYNLKTLPNAPHRARIVAITQSMDDIPTLQKWVREWAKQHLPEAIVVAKSLGQGPPVDAPVEIRIFSEDAKALAEASDQIMSVLSRVQGTVDVRHNLGTGIPKLEYTMNDGVANRYGFDRQDIALTLQGRTSGVQVGEYRMGDDPVPIILRSRDGQNYPAEKLNSVKVYSDEGVSIPLMQIASVDLLWQPGVIHRYNQKRTAMVMSEILPGYTYSQVVETVAPILAELTLPQGVSYAWAGEVKESGDANSALLTSAPLGVIMLLFFLLIEFNSFRRVLIVLVTVPLVMVGVVPGLILSNSSFGFTSLLGVVALIGIVVNNAIVLIDVMNQQLAQSQSLEVAIVSAVERRIRPILLTTLTTVAGLIPLTMTASTLWPPMAWAIISGLIASTGLTLLVIPALCKLLLMERGEHSVKLESQWVK